MKRNRSRVREQPPHPGLTPEQPFTPRPKLLALLSLLFAAWIGFLLVLYFTTVHHP